MILVVTFGSLNPWISKESLNLILGQKRSDTIIPAFICEVLVLVKEVVQTSGQRYWRV